MSAPSNYQWLDNIKGLPNNIRIGIDNIGVQEIAGKGSSRTIMAWRDELNHAGIKIEGYSDDDIPWCGLFAAIVAYRRMKIASEVVTDPLWARNWAKYGTKSPEASLGDCLTFVRNGGGHVGWYVAEDSTAYHVLGGNQSNKVCITRVAKDRCIAVRRPPYKVVPASVKPYLVKASGLISVNEA
jgi:uncharacterized protein (TIGR02594 family)